jgi:hypothetical protein
MPPTPVCGDQSSLTSAPISLGSQGGTVAPAGGNTCGLLSARLDLKPPAVPRSDTDHRTIYLTGIDANGKVAEGFRVQAVQGSELTAR